MTHEEQQEFELVRNEIESIAKNLAGDYCLWGEEDYDDFIQDQVMYIISKWNHVHRPSINPLDNFKYWAIRVITNYSKNRIRKARAKFRKLCNGNQLISISNMSDDVLIKSNVSGLSTSTRILLRDDLPRIISKLPERQRKLIELLYINGYTKQRICIELNLSYHHLDNLIYSTLVNLRSQLDPEPRRRQ